MLPSTGYFKSISCPFYESGCCDRPYCHFKHFRRDQSTVAKDDAATSSTSLPVAQTPAPEAEPKAVPSAVAAAGTGAEIHQLIHEAVDKAFATNEVIDAKTMREQIVAQVVEQLQPSIVVAATPVVPIKPAQAVVGKHVGVPSCVTKPAPYNPTPIAELKKRHISVPVYMPTRESKAAAKRKYPTEPLKCYSSMLRESTNSRAELTYKPTAIVVAQEAETTNSYVPTSRSDNSSSNSYDDGNSNDYVPKTKKEAYYPKVKKRREEYVPKKVKAPLKNAQIEDNPFSDYEIMSEILMSSNTAAGPANDDSLDIYDIEPKFSEDEEHEVEADETSNKHEGREKEDGDEEDLEEKENESDCVEVEIEENSHRTSLKDSHSGRSSGKDKSRRDSTIEKEKERESRKERRKSGKDDSKSESEHSKRDHKKDSRDKSKRDGEAKNDCKDKDKSKSSTRDKHRPSSSNKDRDKSKDKHSSDCKKEHRSKDTSRSHKDKDKVPSSKNDEGKSRSSKSRHDRHSSSSSRSRSDKKTESGKEATGKCSSRSSSHKDSRSEKKSSRKESSSERSCVEMEELSNSPFASSFIDDELMQTSDSDHDVEEECLKIFQEYEPSEHPKGVTMRATSKEETDEVEDVGRKRVAHPSAASSIVRAHESEKPAKKQKDPEQRMYDRWRMMKEAAAAKATEIAKATAAAAAAAKTSVSTKVEKTGTQKLAPPKVRELKVRPNNANSQKGAPEDPKLNGNGRIRIAHVPYAMSLALEKKKVHETIAKAAAVEVKTAAQTAKGGSRVAHIPQVVPQLVAPEPLQPTTQKFPLNVRQHYVNLMHVICVQIYTNGEDAAQRALREELACHDRCKALTVYKNSCMLATHRLRKEAEQGLNGSDALPSASGTVSHNAVIAGKSKGSWSVEKSKKSVVDFKGAALYERLKKWIMTEQQLRDNGFPRSHPDGPKGRAKVYVTNTRNQSILSKVPNERYCCRCNKPYMVNKHGIAVQPQNCIYHWGRKFTTRGESKYMCCQQHGFASGCADAKNHVWEYVDYENLRGYVKTLPKDTLSEEQGVYALDCEMSYTTQGLELTRVTVINEDCNTIYETLVMPENPIIDYNTRFSGITEENMKGVKTTLLDVQATLLTMFSEHTILVGHSLESDFKALKLIHDTVVDTSMMFPHKNGPPFKRALRNLCSEYLRKIIQNEVGGHDSAEDAVACMDLIHWKVKEEAKLQ